MMHNPTYRFRDQGAELRAQTLERDHIIVAVSMTESRRRECDIRERFLPLPTPSNITMNVNTPTIPTPALYSPITSSIQQYITIATGSRGQSDLERLK